MNDENEKMINDDLKWNPEEEALANESHAHCADYVSAHLNEFNASDSWFCVWNNPYVYRDKNDILQPVPEFHQRDANGNLILDCGGMPIPLPEEKVLEIIQDIYQNSLPPDKRRSKENGKYIRYLAASFCIAHPDAPQHPNSRYYEKYTDPQSLAGKTFQLKHIHFTPECLRGFKIGFKELHNIFPYIHIDKTKGSKKQVEGYIKKTGPYAEKDEIVLCFVGDELHGVSKHSRDEIDKMVRELGYSPKEIFDFDPQYKAKPLRDYVYESCRLYAEQKYPKGSRRLGTWIFGESGEGKSECIQDFKNRKGENNCFLVGHYKNGAFDRYSGETYLILDEFKGENVSDEDHDYYFSHAKLNSFLDKEILDVSARYEDAPMLWQHILIGSVYSPWDAFPDLCHNQRDSIKQITRRFSTLVKCRCFFSEEDMLKRREDRDFYFVNIIIRDYEDASQGVVMETYEQIECAFKDSFTDISKYDENNRFEFKVEKYICGGRTYIPPFPVEVRCRKVHFENTRIKELEF